MQTDDSKKPEKPVKTFGPFGVGDPDDLRLRHVERDVIISRMVGEIAKSKCIEYDRQWGRCQAKHGLQSVFYCRGIGTDLKKCIVGWTYDPEIVQDCTEKYLKARTEYRQTGVRSETRLPKSTMKGDLSFH